MVKLLCFLSFFVIKSSTQNKKNAARGKHTQYGERGPPENEKRVHAGKEKIFGESCGIRRIMSVLALRKYATQAPSTRDTRVFVLHDWNELCAVHYRKAKQIPGNNYVYSHQVSRSISLTWLVMRFGWGRNWATHSVVQRGVPSDVHGGLAALVPHLTRTHSQNQIRKKTYQVHDLLVNISHATVWLFSTNNKPEPHHALRTRHVSNLAKVAHRSFGERHADNVHRSSIVFLCPLQMRSGHTLRHAGYDGEIPKHA